MAKTSAKQKETKLANDVVKTEGAGAPSVPDFMKGKAGLGVENVGAGDVAIPRIKLLQGISPEVLARDDLRAGYFYHTISEESLGRELRIVPVYTDIRAILWRPRHSGGGILARMNDGRHWEPANASFEVVLKKNKEDPGTSVKWYTKKTEAEAGLLSWGSSNPADPNSQPAATKMYNIVAMLPDHPELSPVVITLQRAAVKVAMNFTGKLKLSRAPSYGTVFVMSSLQESRNGDTFFNYKFTADGFVQNKEEFDLYEETYNRFKEQGLQIRDEDGLQDEDTTTIDASGDVGKQDAKAAF